MATTNQQQTALHLINDLLSSLINGCQSPNVKKYDVIIIGAGPAGIAAARQLSRNNIKCCILEARNRCGGRAHSEYWSDNISVDYGAQWIHSVPPNGNHLFMKLSKSDLNCDIYLDYLNKESIESKKYHRKKIIWDQQMKAKIPNALYRYVTKQIIKQLRSDILTEDIKPHIKYKDCSVYDMFKDIYHSKMKNLSKEVHITNQYIKTNINNWNSKINKIDTYFIERCIDKRIALVESSDALITDHSFYHYHDDESDGHNVNMQGKYGQFIQLFANNLNKQYVDIKLNNSVKSVQYNYDNDNKDDFVMEIIAENTKTFVSEKYISKHVIVCIPIGCLQSRSIKFIPSLIPSFWKSIDNGIGRTQCEKLIIHFNAQFTINNNITSLNLINKQNKYQCNQSIPAQNQNYGHAFRLGVEYEDRLKDNIWLIFISPSYLKRNQNDNDILNETLSIFRDIFGNGNMNTFPKVQRYHLTNWRNDIYSLGCWCFMKAGGNGKMDCDKILESYNVFDIKLNKQNNNDQKRIQFAGEYAFANGIGTVHAAFNSGTMAANQIIN